MAEKILNTRIALKYDTLANWNNSELILKAGEVAYAYLAANSEYNENNGNVTTTTAPTVLFKVGDGSHKFNELKWGSGLAADVHSWAKQDQEAFTAWVKGLIDVEDIDLSNYKTKQEKYNETGSTIKTLTSISQDENGKIQAVFEDIKFPEIDTGVMSVSGKEAINV